MKTVSLTPFRIVAALAVALLADVIQLPLTIGFSTVILSVLCFMALVAVNSLAFVLTSLFLGFHWALLPALLMETVPGLGAIPSWTASVAYAVWSRRHDHRTQGAGTSIEAGNIRVAENERPARALVVQSTPFEPAPQHTLEVRLARLDQLFGQGAITAEELAAKRIQMLGEL